MVKFSVYLDRRVFVMIFAERTSEGTFSDVAARFSLFSAHSVRFRNTDDSDS